MYVWERKLVRVYYSTLSMYELNSYCMYTIDVYCGLAHLDKDYSS